MRQESLVAALSQAIDQLEPRPWAFGVHEDAQAFQLQLKLAGRKTTDLAWPMSVEPAAAAQALSGLGAAAEPSEAPGPSGASTTAPKQLPAAKVTLKGLQEPEAQILEQVRRALVPEAPSIRAELLKVLVHPSSGATASSSLLYSRMPQDARTTSCNVLPGSKSCFGMLEIVLPTPYQDGQCELTLGTTTTGTPYGRKGIWPSRPPAPPAQQTSLLAADAPDSEEDEEQEEIEPDDGGELAPGEGEDPEAYAERRAEREAKRAKRQAKADGKKWKVAQAEAAEKERAAASKRLQWVACFGDVQQSIKSVTVCPRVSLVYALHRPDHAQAASGGAGGHSLLQRCKNLQRALVSALDSPAFMPTGGKLGIYLRNAYLEAALAKAEDKLELGGAEAHSVNLPFKNDDGAVAAVLATTGLDVKVLRLACKSNYGSHGEFYVMPKMPTKKDAQTFGHRGLLGGGQCGYGTKCWPDQLDRSSQGKLQAVVGDMTWIGSHKANCNFWCRLYVEGSSSPYDSIDFDTSCALVVTVPPLDTRPRARPTLTLAHVQPFKTVAARGKGKRKAAGKAKGGAAKKQKAGAKGKGKKKKGDESHDEEEDEGEETDEEDAEMERQAGRQRRKKAKDEDEEEEGEEEQQREEGDGERVVSLTAPPVLFMPQDASVMTAAQKRVAALQTVRKIHVRGGRGKECDAAAEDSDLRKGIAVITLQPGQVLKELKAAIRKTFGKVVKTKVGPLMMLDANGKATASQVKTDDLVDGARVECTYIQAEGSFGFSYNDGGMGYGYDD